MNKPKKPAKKKCGECGTEFLGIYPICDCLAKENLKEMEKKPSKKEIRTIIDARPEQIRDYYYQGYADAIKDPRSMYNAGFDDGKEAVGKQFKEWFNNNTDYEDVEDAIQRITGIECLGLHQEGA
jgi:ADP-glucose pyrophosphorylase